jgi:hypothetical protein
VSNAKKILAAMIAAFKQEGVRSGGYVTRIGKGARVVKGS